ncbi:MAG TPA: sugar O-acetyltransferase [Enterococcus aquimarinus]|nr:sugar O-acetyltransferase [Enterococcus aquimarinus]
MDLEESKRRMHNGKLYYAGQPELIADQLTYLEKNFDYNQLRPSQQKEKQALLKQLFAEIGKSCYIEAPFHANWGGKHVHLGSHVYVNYNLTLVDDTHIYIGDHVMIAPNVVIATGTHPIHPELRRKEAQFNLPVHIQDNVWLGAGCLVMPGVTIGENSVIGAGSVVTKDIPANVVAVGNPCRVLRDISEKDLTVYHKESLIDIE